MKFYIPSLTEKRIANWYMRMNIYNPHEIDEYVISEKIGLHLIEKPCPSHAYVNGDIKIICIDSRMKAKEQRERFFHELGHIVMHSGSQISIRKNFRMFQEIDATQFTRYAAMPLHMILKLDLTDPYIVETVSDLFSVSWELAELRLLNIKNNILSNLYAKKQYLRTSMV